MVTKDLVLTSPGDRTERGTTHYDGMALLPLLNTVLSLACNPVIKYRDFEIHTICSHRGQQELNKLGVLPCADGIHK